jgi:hypothetical protein
MKTEQEFYPQIAPISAEVDDLKPRFLAQETPASTCPERRLLGGLSQSVDAPDGALCGQDMNEQHSLANSDSQPDFAAAGKLRLDIPTEEENKAALDDFFAGMRKDRAERREAVLLAVPALERLCEVMQHRSGQCYKVRALLYSLYNGQATQLNEVLCLDWAIRKDLCAVILAFGWEEEGVFCGDEKRPGFFYDAMRQAIVKARQWEWFLAAHQEKGDAA